MNSTISPAGTIDFYNSAPRSTNTVYKIKFSRLSPAVPVEYARGPTLVSTGILPKMQVLAYCRLPVPTVG